MEINYFFIYIIIERSNSMHIRELDEMNIRKQDRMILEEMISRGILFEKLSENKIKISHGKKSYITWIVKLSETLKRHVMIYSIYNLPKIRRVDQTCPTPSLPKQS